MIAQLTIPVWAVFDAYWRARDMIKEINCAMYLSKLTNIFINKTAVWAVFGAFASEINLRARDIRYVFYLPK